MAERVLGEEMEPVVEGASELRGLSWVVVVECLELARRRKNGRVSEKRAIPEWQVQCQP